MIYDKSKWIYEADEGNSIRYVLGTKGNKTLICFGVNPSTAIPDNLDNTLRSVNIISKYNKYDSWIMLNLYPQRNRYVNSIHKELDEETHKKNCKYIRQVFNLGHYDIWTAWGTLIERRKYFKKCLADIYELSNEFNCNWYRAGNLTKYGHPHHPLFLAEKTDLKLFDLESYMKELSEYWI